MLPFMKNKDKGVGVFIKTRQPDQPDQAPEEDQGLMACASDMIKAIQSNDIKGLAAAMKSAFDILESESHEEAPQDGGEEDMGMGE